LVLNIMQLRHGDCLLVDTAAGVAQLDTFRGFLAGGFQDHLQNNPLMHDIFDHEPQQEASDRLSKTEKRLFRSKNSTASRARNRSIGVARSQAASNHHDLLGEAW
jgi:urease accessory protein UreF